MTRRFAPTHHPVRATAAALLLGTAALSAFGSSGEPSAEQKRTTCADLNGKVFDDVKVTATKRFDAAQGNPGFCQVLATRAPYLDLEVDLPDNWSGRLWQQGGDGTDGLIRPAVTVDANTGAITQMNLALKTGLAIYASSNGGNRRNVPAQAARTLWRSGTAEGRESMTDYNWRSLDTTRRLAKALALAYYGQAPRWTYLNGCSNGGRNAYIAAERWPTEYDGVVAGCETMDMAGHTAAGLSMISKLGTPAMPSAAQWQSVTTAAMNACDALDGLKDGLVANQSACTFDVVSLQCGQPGASTDPPMCLSPAQVATVRAIRSDLKLANGATVYSGFNWTRLNPWDWTAFVPPTFAMLATGEAAWVDSPAKWAAFDLVTHYPAIQSGLAAAGADHDKKKIAAFVASGRKILSWHNIGDERLSLNDHYRNHTEMARLAQGLGLAEPSVNTRFFAAPGGRHSEGSELTGVNWFEAITHWVEKGIAPQQLTLQITDAQTNAVRTLPVCQHPRYPKYDGRGDVNAAGSYRCAMP